MQGGLIRKDPYAQLPGFGDAECAKVKKMLNGKTLFNYCMLTPAEREAHAPEIFGENHK